MQRDSILPPAGDFAWQPPEAPPRGFLRRSNWAIHMLALAAAALMIAAHVADGSVGEGPRDERAWPGDPIFYELELFTPAGDVLFNPRLLGEANKPTKVELWGQSDRDGCRAPRLTVSLDALAARGGLDMSMELTVGGLIEKHPLRLRMPMNEGQTLWVPTDDGRTLGMTLRAFKVGSPAFDAYVEAMQRRAAGRMPEA